MGAFDGIATFAGGVQDSLENLILRKMKEADQQHRFANDDTRLSIDQQRADDEKAYRMENQRLIAEQRATQQRAANVGTADKLADDLAIGQDLSPSTAAALKAGERGDLVKAPTLGSTNITGNLTQGQLRMMPNPGKGETYLGTAAQQQQKAQDEALSGAIGTASDPKIQGMLRMIQTLPQGNRASALVEAMKETAKPAEHSAAYKEWQDAVASGYKGNFTQYQNEDANRKRAAAPQPSLVQIQTVDENGNPVTRIVKKEEGASYAKPANATTATRVSSAETVNQVGDDIIGKLKDPRFAATVGPALGRAGTLRDFIGNPPPEFSELAGQIESYALANMGVHGMRSAQGAEAIKKLLDTHHTPESLAATIRGLNDFSTRFVANNKPKASGAAASTSAGKPSATDLIKKYGG